MADTVARVANVNAGAGRVQNADVRWNTFSSEDYWEHNYRKLLPEDREIIRRTSEFFIRAFADKPAARHPRRGIDVGTGTNLYPALLMLPWADQILLTDFSARNVGWLDDHVAGRGRWTWGPFWSELRESKGYNLIVEPRKHLQEACVMDPGLAGIEQRSVFDLPKRKWDLGTMFFVAESITEDPGEFRSALAGFLGALKPGAPFAAAFMAGSDGYPVADERFPALPIAPKDVRQHLTKLGTTDLSVEIPQTEHRVRDGYQAMIVATGFVRNR